MKNNHTSNCNEAAVFVKVQSDKPWAFRYRWRKELDLKGKKDCLTLCFCTVKTGGQALTCSCSYWLFSEPWWFYYPHRTKLPLIYASSKNVWMMRQIFHDWFHKNFGTQNILAWPKLFRCMWKSEIRKISWSLISGVWQTCKIEQEWKIEKEWISKM